MAWPFNDINNAKIVLTVAMDHNELIKAELIISNSK